MNLKKLTITMTGDTPMLMHGDKLADPTNPATLRHKELTKQRTKTPEIHAAMAESEWLHSLYLSSEGKVVMPPLNIRASLIGGAKLNKLGMAIKRGVFFNPSDVIILKHNGPSDLKKMYESGLFKDVRTVRVGTSRVMRCRPMFPEWSLSITISFDPDVISRRDLEMCFNNAGSYAGLGDFRPMYGRFSCTFK